MDLLFDRGLPPARRASRTLLATVLVAALLVGACSAGNSASPSPTGGPVTREQAVALVLARDPAFAGIGPLEPTLIGASAWYEVARETTRWRVTITKGWGDCQAGCISRHVWHYVVDSAGGVTLLEETGDPLQDGAGVSPGARVRGGPTLPAAGR